MSEPIHPARSVPRGAWRWPVLPLLAATLAAGGCGDRPGNDTGEPGGADAPPGAPGTAPAAPAAGEPAPPPPGLAAPDPLEMARDSIQEAELYNQRQRSMESFASCMQKAKDLEPAQRQMIEAACKRLPTAPR